jgi:HAD superfamily hydrolase (TIGR01458 family)
MKNLLFDMDGVLYEGERAIAGALETLAWCRNRGLPHRFLTNTTSRPRRALVSKLAEMGLTVTEEEILTPPVAAGEWLRQHANGPVALFVPAATQQEFAAIEVAGETATSVTAVVLGDLGSGWDFATYNRAFRLLMDNPGAPLIALGLSRYWQAEEGLRLDVGPFIKGLEYAAGREALLMGKPAAPFFQAALAQLGAEAAETLMLGDDIRGDIDGAQQAGINGVLVRSGKFRPVDLQQGITPYAVLDSIAALPAWWCQQGW